MIAAPELHVKLPYCIMGGKGKAREKNFDRKYCGIKYCE